jgi:hypothetical protein
MATPRAPRVHTSLTRSHHLAAELGAVPRAPAADRSRVSYGADDHRASAQPVEKGRWRVRLWWWPDRFGSRVVAHDALEPVGVAQPVPLGER